MSAVTVDRLSVASATVTADGNIYTRATVLVADGHATAKADRGSGALLAERAGVTSVVRESRRAYIIHFEDGATWQVQRTGCGCGRG